jgi:hypothetical protein
VPEEVEAWQLYTSDPSIVSTEDETQRNLLELGFAAVGAAFNLGTSQTQSIILLEEENRQLKRKNDALEKDCGISVGYIGPEDVERLKARAQLEIEDRDSIIERLKDRLTAEKQPYNRDMAKATVEIDKLKLRGDKFKERVDQLMKEGLQQKNQIDFLDEALAQEKASNENLIMQLNDVQHRATSTEVRLMPQREVHKELANIPTAVAEEWDGELSSSSSPEMETDWESSNATGVSSDNTGEELQNEVQDPKKESTELKEQDTISRKRCNDQKMALRERITKLEQDAKTRLEHLQIFLRSLPESEDLRKLRKLPSSP